MPSEIERRAQEIRDMAATCECMYDLMKKLDWPMPSVIAANDKLGLGLPMLRPNRAPKRAAQAVPKPVPKKK